MDEKSCECANWCRTDPQPITDKHHKSCAHYNDKIRVVKIEMDGNFFCDKDIRRGLEILSYEVNEDAIYTVEFMEMLEREYEALPEFEGF